MVHKKEEAVPLRRVCINLREGDYEWLQAFFDKSPSEAIRSIIIKFRKKVEDKAAHKMPTIHNLELDYEDIDV
jgi:hypothetical protein